MSLTLSDYGSYFDVYVDGALQAGGPVVGNASQSTYPIATGLDPAVTHEVRLAKRTEASGNGRTQLLGVTFPSGGTLLPPPPAATRRLEVIGDSISCGYGVLGATATCTETPAVEDQADTYEALTGKALGAEVYVIASSGRGMYINNDGTTTGTLPDIYGLTVPYGTTATPSAWSFASWVPDAVVITLGTNDFAGSNGDPGAPFETAYLAFLKRVRQNYPSAVILLANSPMLSGAEYTAEATHLQAVITQMADAKVTYLPFATQLAANGAGCDYHPSPATHQIMATALEAALSAALGW